MQYTLKPDAQGFHIIDNKNGLYKPGDVLQFSGSFKAVAIYNLNGTAAAPIKITNVPGQVLTIGDIAWSGGAWAHGLAIRGSHYLEIYGDQQSNFKIIGSNSAVKDPNGYPVRTAYFNFLMTELTDNIKAHDIMISHGGTGVFAKTEVLANDPKTWFGNTQLNNFEFYNLDISDTYNEAMYIGHTATYWNIKTNQPFYGTTTDTTTYKQPVKIYNLKIHNNNIHDTYTDGIQIAAAAGVEVYDNTVTNWAINKDFNHNGGILIGGRVADFTVRNNIVQNGWGEFLQIYADAGNAIIRNNLFVNNLLSGIGMRGGKGLAVQFLNNTIINSGEHAFRINGANGDTEIHLLDKNIIAGYHGKSVYLENGGNVITPDNKIFDTLTASGLSIATDYTSPPSLKGYGYKDEVIIVPPPPEPEIKVIATIDVGGYVFTLFENGESASQKI